jgi:hypothetical protein
LTKKLLKPFAELWTELALNHRLAIEAHAQNVFIQIESKGHLSKWCIALHRFVK